MHCKKGCFQCAFTTPPKWWQTHNPRYLLWRLTSRIKRDVMMFKRDRKWRNPPKIKTWTELRSHDRAVERVAIAHLRYWVDRAFEKHYECQREVRLQVLALFDREIDRK